MGRHDPGLFKESLRQNPFLCACRPARPHSWRAARLCLGVGTSAWASLSFRLTDSLHSRKPLTQPSPPGGLSLGGKNLAKPPGEISSDANDEIFHCLSLSLCVPPSSGILLFFFFWLVPISCNWKLGGPLAIPVLTENSRLLPDFALRSPGAFFESGCGDS